MRAQSLQKFPPASPGESAPCTNLPVSFASLNWSSPRTKTITGLLSAM